MALKPCKECATEVSSDAPTCPKCGKKNPTGKTSPAAMGCLILLVLFVVLPVIGKAVGPASSAATIPESAVGAGLSRFAQVPTVQEPSEPAMPIGQAQATLKAKSYLRMGGFSRKGLIHQLTFEGFSDTEASATVDRIAPDWNEQAAQKAKSYLKMGGFSRKSLIHQLVFEGFTSDQAEFGAQSVGY